jgi:UDP-3-O-acyl-N-acetylglucosamine deacetylase
LALAESANLLSLPGRVCSNGAAAPIADPSWSKFVEELRDAGLKAYAAAQAKDRDKMIELSEPINEACVHCHRKWRPRTAENRCR